MNTHKAKQSLILLLITILSVLSGILVRALPVGPTITVLSNSTISSTPYSLQDQGGYIYYSTVTATQQDYGWKAYIGNVTGSFTLDDANGKTIYDWEIDAAALQGEIYATRNNSITWSAISCANTTVIGNETEHFGMPTTDSDNINNTFNSTTHKFMQVGTNPITASTCKAIATYVNNSRQAVSQAAFYQEILLSDSNFHLLYATWIETDKFNYQGSNATSDFQMIIPENKTQTTPTTYYFYVEIG